jgi:hypothetical protein
VKKSNGIALVVALILGMAGPALAGGASTGGGLTAGGRTLAGPAALSVGPGLTATVYTHAATNTNACGTVAASSKGSAVRMTLVGLAASTATFDVAAGGAGSLCKDQLIRMDVTCLGTTACGTQWRVDRN